MDYLEWVINWFSENGKVSSDEIRNHLDDNYFELGYIDSFAFIMLIMAIEEELNTSFDNDRFQDRSFSTINGLVNAIKMENRER